MSVAPWTARRGKARATTAAGFREDRLAGLRSLSRVPGIVPIVVLALLARALYGSGYVWYDALYHLIWGHDLITGHLPPDLQVVHSPTPHPLPLAVSAAAAALGSGAYAVMETISLLSLGGLCWAGFRLGQRLAGWPVGALVALILFTRPFLISQTLLASIETPYLALILCAAAMEVHRPRRGLPVIAVLGLAGLIRPEAWVLNGLYWLWLAPTRSWPERARLAAAVLVAPLLWTIFDLVSTGDPLHSLHETKNAQEQPDTPRSLGSGLLAGPTYLRNILQLPIVLAGVAGVAIAVRQYGRRALAPLVIGLSGVATFLVFGVAGLSLKPRYSFQPAVILALFAAVALLGWRELHPGTLARRVAMGVAAVVALAVVVFFPLSSLNGARDTAAHQHTLQTDLVALLGTQAFSDARRTCEPLRVTDHFNSPPTAYILHGHARDVIDGDFVDGTRGLMLTFVRSPVPLAFGLPLVDPTRLRVPTVARPVVTNRSWAVYASCP